MAHVNLADLERWNEHHTILVIKVWDPELDTLAAMEQEFRLVFESLASTDEHKKIHASSGKPVTQVKIQKPTHLFTTEGGTEKADDAHLTLKINKRNERLGHLYLLPKDHDVLTAETKISHYTA